MKFNEIPLKVNVCSNPFRTPNGRLPVLRTYDDGMLDSAKSIIEYLGKKYNKENGLTQKLYADVIAYDELLKEKLYPALQFIWYVYFGYIHVCSVSVVVY